MTTRDAVGSPAVVDWSMAYVYPGTAWLVQGVFSRPLRRMSEMGPLDQ